MHPLAATFLVFALALLISHLPVLWVLRRREGRIADKDSWAVWCEYSDYLSLGLAVLALIPAANEVRRHFSGLELKQRLRYVGYAYTQDYAKNTLGHYERWPAGEKDPAVTAGLAEALKALQEGDQYLNEGKELLRTRRTDEADEKLDRAIKAYDGILSRPRDINPKAAFARDVQLIREGVKGQRDYALDLRQQAGETNKGVPEIILLWLSPYVLAIGLAVRIGKVSAKLQLEAQKRLPPPPSPEATPGGPN